MNQLQRDLDRLAGGIRGIRLAFFGDRNVVSKVIVTDHALLRYLERVRGFKFDRERREIEEICRGVTTARVKKEGFTYEVRNAYVVTIVPDLGAGHSPGRTVRDRVMGPRQRRGPD